MWLNHVTEVVSTIAIVATAVVAIGTLRAHRIATEVTSRPMMMASLEPDPVQGRVAYLVIANYGKGVAKNVHVLLDPNTIAPTTRGRERELADRLLARYAQSVPVWIPGLRTRDEIR